MNCTYTITQIQKSHGKILIRERRRRLLNIYTLSPQLIFIGKNVSGILNQPKNVYT